MWGIKCSLSTFCCRRFHPNPGSLFYFMLRFSNTAQRFFGKYFPSVFADTKNWWKCHPNTCFGCAMRTHSSTKMCAFNFGFSSLNSAQTVFVAWQFCCCWFWFLCFCVASKPHRMKQWYISDKFRHIMTYMMVRFLFTFENLVRVTTL